MCLQDDVTLYKAFVPLHSFRLFLLLLCYPVFNVFNVFKIFKIFEEGDVNIMVNVMCNASDVI